MGLPFDFLSDQELINFAKGNQPAAGISNTLADRYSNTLDLLEKMKGKDAILDELILRYETDKLASVKKPHGTGAV